MKNKIKFQSYYFLILMTMVTVLTTSCSKDDDNDPDSKVAAPTLSNASELQATSFKASWTKVDLADSYLIEVSKKSDFSSTVTGYNKKSVTTNSAVISGLEGETKYYFRVYAKDGSDISKASAAKDATTTKLIAGPVLKDATDIQNTSFKIEWTAITGADKYLVEVSSKSDFSSTVAGFNKKEVSEISASVSGLTTKTKYYVRVYTKKGADVSKPSAVKEITTS
ncbi:MULTISPECIES: fibronectin type III domain-containing protein [Arenibacter]|uniref:fibronectin type III domain-containing protein n=1 Tax=Arenibacter TaxID=178469 RepID=UPI000856F039|nr:MULTISPECIES: fibronectin type III domain-containing protein [Arenibacter]GBF19063.1 fibronectin type III domain protein [Arenibacter sp. NBRC 103722]